MPTITYRRLSRTEREIIHRMTQEGNKQTKIAKIIGRHQTTVSRELKRNAGGWGYRPDQAQRIALARQKAKKPRCKVITGAVKSEVIRRLKANQTPELITGAMRRKRCHRDFPSHETIYQFIAQDKIAGGNLWSYLPINRKRIYRRRSKACRRGGLQIPNRVSIEQRPQVVEQRKRYGEWEVDLISGFDRSGYILSVYERKSRFAKIYKLATKSSADTAAAIITVLAGYRVRTLTFDNGLEFAKHELVTEALGAKGYFCAPYHSWEKGGVENYNRLVRLYYPKKACFKNITQDDLERIETELNQRPKKILGFRSPIEYETKLAA